MLSPEPIAAPGLRRSRVHFHPRSNASERAASHSPCLPRPVPSAQLAFLKENKDVCRKKSTERYYHFLPCAPPDRILQVEPRSGSGSGFCSSAQRGLRKGEFEREAGKAGSDAEENLFCLPAAFTSSREKGKHRR